MIETIATGSVVLACAGVISYFAKKQNDKIERFSEALGELESTLKAEMRLNRDEVVKLFQEVCHERQESCGKLTDLKIDSLKKDGLAICHKITTIREDRTIRWQNQDKLNEDIRKHIIKENNK